MKTAALSTKLPVELLRTLDLVCKRFGMRKNHVIETALREKIEDMLDSEDLKQAISEETRLHDWNTVKNELDKAP